jgi:hypothetical protein
MLLDDAGTSLADGRQMRDFNDLQFFAAVVTHRGFSAAARALERFPPDVNLFVHRGIP